MTPGLRRLGVYNDGPLAKVDAPDGPRLSADPADFPFLTFACEVGQSFDRTVLFGRGGAAPAQGEPLLLRGGIALVELPSYDSLLRLDQVARAVPGTLRGFWRGLSSVDAVWVLGPHPFAFLLVALAAVRRKRVVLGVRQDTVAYFRGRLPGARWWPALVAAHVWNAGFRVLARILRTTVVGSEMSRRYAARRDRLLPMTISLVRAGDVVAPRQRDWSGTVELLAVGRIDREKNPLLLVEALAALEGERPGRFVLRWAGTGPLRDAVRERACELGVEGRLELLGFVPFGAELLELYRQAHMFVHVSLTEGVPAVLIEAMASATPVVATAVGGVAAALDDGRAGLLVPPADLGALVGALLETVDEPRARERRVGRGLELARGCTLEAQASRVARFIRAGGAASVS